MDCIISEGTPYVIVELAAESNDVWMGCHDGHHDYFLVHFDWRNGDIISCGIAFRITSTVFFFHIPMGSG